MRLAATLLVISTAIIGLNCTPSMIPGTDIQDTKTNHEILDVVASYRNAIEAHDVDTVLKLVSKDFFERSTSSADGTYDYAGLEKRLRDWAKLTKSIRLGIQVKTIVVEENKARVQYFYDLNYQIPGPDNTLIWKRDSEAKEMLLRRENSLWRITSGV